MGVLDEELIIFHFVMKYFEEEQLFLNEFVDFEHVVLVKFLQF
jgi:hypothetical protein